MKQHAFALQAVAPGAPGFLLVMLDALWNSHVHHGAHVAAINAHAERHGGHHNVKLLSGESLLHLGALDRSHACVVARRIEFLLAQVLRDRLRLFAAHAIDNHRIATMPLKNAQNLLAPINARLDAVNQVGAVEIPNQYQRIDQFQLRNDVIAHRRRGGGGACVQAHAWEHAPQLLELPILGSEIVAPLADAVRLINGDGAYAHAAEPGIEPRRKQSFR